jgi:antitoxin VapB
MNGRSEAVRLPRECRFGTHEVCIKKVGDMVLLFPREKAWDVFMKGVEGFSKDYMSVRSDSKPQKRPDYDTLSA